MRTVSKWTLDFLKVSYKSSLINTLLQPVSFHLNVLGGETLIEGYPIVTFVGSHCTTCNWFGSNCQCPETYSVQVEVVGNVQGHLKHHGKFIHMVGGAQPACFRLGHVTQTNSASYTDIGRRSQWRGQKTGEFSLTKGKIGCIIFSNIFWHFGAQIRIERSHG